MNLKLSRMESSQKGVFSVLEDETGQTVACCLEHAYAVGDDPYGWAPKVPRGTYLCVRGTHLLEPTDLHPEPKPFETFEITGVPGHSKILFHVGNKNEDSNGCVLVGHSFSGNPMDSVLDSGDAFAVFMKTEEGLDSFTLTVA